jgi:hypothetical protein
VNPFNGKKLIKNILDLGENGENGEIAFYVFHSFDYKPP